VAKKIDLDESDDQDDQEVVKKNPLAGLSSSSDEDEDPKKHTGQLANSMYLDSSDL
jgi:hypothetical protein